MAKTSDGGGLVEAAPDAWKLLCVSPRRYCNQADRGGKGGRRGQQLRRRRCSSLDEKFGRVNRPTVYSTLSPTDLTSGLEPLHIHPSLVLRNPATRFTRQSSGSPQCLLPHDPDTARARPRYSITASRDSCFPYKASASCTAGHTTIISLLLSEVTSEPPWRSPHLNSRQAHDPANQKAPIPSPRIGERRFCRHSNLYRWLSRRRSSPI